MKTLQQLSVVPFNMGVHYEHLRKTTASVPYVLYGCNSGSFYAVLQCCAGKACVLAMRTRFVLQAPVVTSLRTQFLKQFLDAAQVDAAAVNPGQAK